MRCTGLARARELRLAALLAVALCATAIPSSAAATPIGGYAALGDSYTSGPLIANGVGPLTCLRSDHNYPSLVAAAIHPASFADVSCSGARIHDMASPQGTLLAPPAQLDALSPATDLVTVQIGANDAEIVRAISQCSTVGVVLPIGAPCRDQFLTAAGDRLSGETAFAEPFLAAVIKSIHARAPEARALVLGYPDILPQTDAGCWPTVALTAPDVSYLRAKELELNAMIARVAAANDAEYVDLYTRSLGHDACQPAGTRWIEGLLPGAQAYPVHPNELEMQDAALAIEATLAHPKPAAAPPACPARRVRLSLHLRAVEHLVRAVLYLDDVRTRTLRSKRHRHIMAQLAAGDAGYVKVRVAVRARTAGSARSYEVRGVLSRCPPS